MKGLDSIKFRLYKCNNLIVPSTFSKQDMELCGMNSFCFATRLLHSVKKRWMQQKTNEDETQAVLALLKGLRNNVDFTDVASGFHSEKAAFLEVTKILQCFFRSISLSAMTFNKRDLKKQGISTDKVKLEHLGMGGAEIWRGTPDSRVRGFARDSDVALLPGGEPAGEDSNGTSTAIEAKLQIKKIHLQQLVKTAVVASFIENNRHPDLNTIVPTILIDTTHIVVALYCAKKDLLFISDKTRWRHDTKFNWVGITFLWAMINHRYEMQAQPSVHTYINSI